MPAQGFSPAKADCDTASEAGVHLNDLDPVVLQMLDLLFAKDSRRIGD